MKLILTEPGYEKLTGHFGSYDFVDGKSTTDVEPRVACRTAAVMRCTWENGKVPDMGVEFGNAMSMKAPIVADQVPNEGEKIGRIGGDDLKVNTTGPYKVATPLPSEAAIAHAPASERAIYTEAQLGEVADKSGAAGVREIATTWGVKGRSVAELISGVLKAQAVAVARNEVA